MIFHLENFEELAKRAGLQEEKWLLLESSELLRQSSAEGDLLAYLGRGRFAWLSLSDEKTIRAAIAQQEREMCVKLLQRGHAVSLRYRLGVALLDDATGWNLSRALDLAEEESWPVRLGDGIAVRNFAAALQ